MSHCASASQQKGASCDGRNKKEHPAPYTKKQGKARMASDGNLCGDSLRSPDGGTAERG
jgi:hypothetical protein